jgi:coenzyme F420-reducing hydrogenase gamma subunit
MSFGFRARPGLCGVGQMKKDLQLKSKPRLAVYKFASCDGCQLSLLDCEDELLELTEVIHIANFPEATRRMEDGPYDLVLVEGSITTPHDLERIKEVRAQANFLVTIGACATSGGIQALRNFASVDSYARYVYAQPEYLSTLAKSTAISEHIKVDYELYGCPINKHQLLEVVSAFLNNRKPQISAASVCMECKASDLVCVMVSKGVPCLGPITHAGCGALCPTYRRGCFGCYGPKENSNRDSLNTWIVENSKILPERLRALFLSYHCNRKEWKESES